jgi:cobalamin biosynthesis protein CbiG
MTDIFLSYKREDKALVEALAKALEDEGLSVWWDSDLPLGKSYASSISSALTDAKVVIPLTQRPSTSDGPLKRRDGKRAACSSPAARGRCRDRLAWCRLPQGWTPGECIRNGSS